MWLLLNNAIISHYFLFSSYLSLSFPGSSVSKESACSAGNPSSIPGSGRCPGEGNNNALKCTCLENPMDRVAWRVPRVGHNLVTKPPLAIYPEGECKPLHQPDHSSRK